LAAKPSDNAPMIDYIKFDPSAFKFKIESLTGAEQSLTVILTGTLENK